MPAPSAAKAQSPQEKTVKKSRDKSAAFVKLATKRVNRALTALDSIAALSNRRSYTYDAAQIERIDKALTDRMLKLLNAFKQADSGSNSGFTL